MDPPAKKQEGRGTLFGKLMDRFAAGIDSETGEKLSQDNLKTIDDPGPLGKGAETSSSKSIYSEDRHFDSDDVENFGYPGRKRSSSSKSSTGLGLGDPDDVGHSGSFGLDAHGGAKLPAKLPSQHLQLPLLRQRRVLPQQRSLLKKKLIVKTLRYQQASIP